MKVAGFKRDGFSAVSHPDPCLELPWFNVIIVFGSAAVTLVRENSAPMKAGMNSVTVMRKRCGHFP